jgi:Zn ribbon nucleic-acid-binding protein
MSNLKGKFRKSLDGRCPDCEEKKLQLREKEGVVYVVCTVCGYEEPDIANNKHNVDEMRRVKNADKVRDDNRRTSSPNLKKNEQGIKPSWKRPFAKT